MEYYSTVERNKALIHATIWMNPENIISEAIYKGLILCDSIYDLSRIAKPTDRSRFVVAKGLGKRGNGE